MPKSENRVQLPSVGGQERWSDEMPILSLEEGAWWMRLIKGRADELITPDEREHLKTVTARLDILGAAVEKIGHERKNLDKFHELTRAGQPIPGDLSTNPKELEARRAPYESEAQNLCIAQRDLLKKIWQRVKPI